MVGFPATAEEVKELKQLFKSYDVNSNGRTPGPLGGGFVFFAFEGPPKLIEIFFEVKQEREGHHMVFAGNG